MIANIETPTVDNNAQASPERRTKGQKLMPIPVTDEFLHLIDRGSFETGLGDRSKFVRLAVKEKLEAMGIKCGQDSWIAPPRFGKHQGKGRKPRSSAINPDMTSAC